MPVSNNGKRPVTKASCDGLIAKYRKVLEARKRLYLMPFDDQQGPLAIHNVTAAVQRGWKWDKEGYYVDKDNDPAADRYGKEFTTTEIEGLSKR